VNILNKFFSVVELNGFQLSSPHNTDTVEKIPAERGEKFLSWEENGVS
jgi:hypothetical protein